MLFSNLVIVVFTAISLFFTFQVSKSLTSYIFDEIFVPATNFETYNFDTNNFESTMDFDLYEEILSAFDSVQSEPLETVSNAANLLADSPSSTSVFAPPPSSSSETPGESPTSSSDSPPPPPLASAQSTTGHSGRTYRIRSISFTFIIIVTMVERSSWFKRRPSPSPPLPPPPPPPRPPPSPPPSPPSPPSLPPLPSPSPPVSAPPNLSPTSSPASAVHERLVLVAAPARQVAGARRKSRRAKKRG